MSGRILITEVQWGLIKWGIENNEPDESLKILNEVFENQYIGHSKDIKNDVKNFSKLCYRSKEELYEMEGS